MSEKRPGPSVERPHGNTVVWRYMGLDKFLDVLLNRRLYFTPMGELTDKYEAMLPKRDYERMQRRWKEELTSDEVNHRVYELFSRLFDLRDRTVVSSWSKGPDESYGLWKIYLGGARAGVAIRTTVSRIERALSNSGDGLGKQVLVAQVNYGHSLGPEEPSWEQIVTRKTPYYEYEREVRCFLLLAPVAETVEPSGFWEGKGLIPPPASRGPRALGRHLPVDLEELVQELYISPFAGKWLRDVVVQLLRSIESPLADRVKTSHVRDA